jgi:PiT family inorganic phosphate transporter
VLSVLLFFAVCFVAFTNGANDNFKGVASLYGSGTTSLRVALYRGTAATLAGSLAAFFLAEGLLKKFGGRGLLPDTIIQSEAFVCAVALGTA